MRKPLTIAATALFLCTASAWAETEKPNVVFMLIDDLGWADTGIYGSTFYETPHVDRLAKEGMRFTQAYAAASICSPTRSSIMTGKYPARLNQTDWIPGMGDSPDHRLLQVQDTNHLPLEETTIAEALDEAGYFTAHMGKWHLGGGEHLPKNQGFDVNIAGNRHGAPPSYFYPYKRGGYQLEELAKTGEEGEYLTTRLGEEAVRLIKNHKDEPFFLYFAHYAVHTPLQAPEKLVEKYRKKKKQRDMPDRPVLSQEHGHKELLVQNNPVFAAMVEKMDETVGMVREALEEAGVEEETIVIFFSDNGGLSTDHPSTSNFPLRAGKGWMYEGGFREPLIVRWPGVTKPGSVSDTPVISTDFYRTILDIVGRPVPDGAAPDGVSLVPLLEQSGGLDRNTLYWHYPHYHGGGNIPSGAIRSGSYKLIEYFGTGETELYNLAKDMRERKDLSLQRPAKARELHQKLKAWRDRVDAQMPKPNPNYKGD